MNSNKQIVFEINKFRSILNACAKYEKIANGLNLNFITTFQTLC